MLGVAAIPTHSAWSPSPRKVSLPPVPTPWQPVRIAPKLGQTDEQMENVAKAAKGLAVGIMMIPTLFGAATAYVGFRLGKVDDGLPSAIGYVVGTLGALGALGSIFIMLGIANLSVPKTSTSELVSAR